MIAAAMLPSASQPVAAFEIFGLKLFEGDEAEEIPVTDPLRYTVAIEVVGEVGGEALRERLQSASELAREVEKPVSGSVGLISRANSDFEQLVGALYEDARYGGVVQVFVDGRPLEELPPDTDLSASEPVPVRILVTPGQQFLFGDVRIVAEDGVTREPSLYGLARGEPAGSEVILTAETRLVRELRGGGRPLAEVTGRDVVADHDRGVLDVVLSVSPGPVAAFGITTVEGTKDVNAAFVAKMTGIPIGDTYDPEALDAATRRLRSLDVFSSITVRGRKALAADGSVPVDVAVTERKHRYLGLGATFSSTEGGGLEAYWGHRNLFGRAEKLRLEGSISGLGDTAEVVDLTYKGAILFEKPGVLGPASKFTSSLAIEQENPDAYRRFSVEAKVGVSYELSEKQTVSAGVSVEYAELTDSFDVELETLTVALPLEYVLDRRDDELDPTSGYRLLLALEPTWEALNSSTFLKMRGQASVYRALDDANRFVVAGRIGAGSIVGADLSDVPANRRFFAGGGGSVRGYAYQGIGPRDALNKPTGGLSMLEASGELRFGVTETVGIVPFLDAGLVSSESFWSNGAFQLGAGVGLRYQTPFGPLRIDVAVPLNKQPTDPDFGIYAGIGQAF